MGSNDTNHIISVWFGAIYARCCCHSLVPSNNNNVRVYGYVNYIPHDHIIRCAARSQAILLWPHDTTMITKHLWTVLLFNTVKWNLVRIRATYRRRVYDCVQMRRCPLEHMWECECVCVSVYIMCVFAILSFNCLCHRAHQSANNTGVAQRNSAAAQHATFARLNTLHTHRD